MDMYFVGMHHPSAAQRVELPFVSVNTLKRRKSAFPVQEWVMDSGAFSVIKGHGDYLEPPSVYAAEIRRWANNGYLLAAVSQDYMCEPEMLVRTGKSVAEHQRLTIERYDALMACDRAGIYIMPVLQGYAPDEYVRHLQLYGHRLAHGAWVGVGSVCKRKSAYVIESILAAIKRMRPDLRLHGFGLKITALRSALVCDLLHSADSMSWSVAAKWAGRNGNDWREAQRFQSKVQTLLAQGSLFASDPTTWTFAANVTVFRKPLERLKRREPLVPALSAAQTNLFDAA